MTLPLSCPLKNLIAPFLMPVSVVLELFILGWLLRRFTRFKRTGLSIILLAAVLFLAFGFGCADVYLCRLERQYPPLQPTPAQCETLRGATVVVLGQGIMSTSDLDLRYRGNATFQLRLQEGIRVCRLIPDSRLLVSMAGGASDADKSAYLATYAGEAGLSTNRVRLFTGARDTPDEARLAIQLAPTNTVILATSAAHLPRAMTIFRKQGVTPVPAPCDYQCLQVTKRWGWQFLSLPRAEGFEHAEILAHEWFGACYERLSD
jgi:uncharacterized SAM-binding protein YcdF (DUF218 family)